jgi:DNA-binding transcriptional LysR family regulator
MVAAGLGVTLASDLGRVFAPPSGIRIVPFERPLRRAIVVAHLPHAEDRPTVRAVLDAFRRAAAAQGLETPAAGEAGARVSAR